MRSFSLFLSTLLEPYTSFAEMKTGKGGPAAGTGSGLLALLAGVLSLLLAGILIVEERGATARKLFSGFGTTLIFLALLSLVFKGALFHLFASIWGKRGRAEDLLRFMLFSYLPFIFLVPAAAFLSAAGLGGLYALVFLAALGYSYKMEVSALRAVYGLPTRRAVLVFLVPLLLQLLFLFIFLLGVLSTIAGLLLGGSGLL